MTCVKPFTIPDRWIENQTRPGIANDTFDIVDNHGNPLANPDVYIPADQSGYTGYNAERDKGMRADDPRRHRQQRRRRASTSPTRLAASAAASEYRVEHRQLQHHHDGLGRPARWPSPATWSARPTRASTTDREGSRVPTGIRRQQSRQHDDPQPACCRHPALRPGLLRHGQAERPERRPEGRQLPRLLHHIGRATTSTGASPRSPGLVKGNGGPAPAGAFPKAIRLVE